LASDTPRSDAEAIADWRTRLREGEPWEVIEAEVLELTGGVPEAVLSLLLTAIAEPQSEGPDT